MNERYKDFVDRHGNGIIITSSLLLITILTGILITATGKAIIIEFDGINAVRRDEEGNYEEDHVDGGRVKFYAE